MVNQDEYLVNNLCYGDLSDGNHEYAFMGNCIFCGHPPSLQEASDMMDRSLAQRKNNFAPQSAWTICGPKPTQDEPQGLDSNVFDGRPTC